MNPHSKGGHAAADRKCSVEGCDRPAWGKGWCYTHYMRMRRLGSLELPVRPLRLCEVCGVAPRSSRQSQTCGTECAYALIVRRNNERQAPAAPPPPFPRRTIVSDYCRTCGRTSGCWPGCAGGERVAAISHTRSPASATMDTTSDARSTDLGSTSNGHLEHERVPYE